MPSEPAYGVVHQRVREYLLRVTPPGTPCPLCDEPMWPEAEPIDLHHSDPELKKLGMPGDALAHRKCNRATRRKEMPPEVAAKRERQRAKDASTLTEVAPRPRCQHSMPLLRERRYGDGCQCSNPKGHHDELARAAKAAGRALETDHYPPACPGCGGFTSSRIW